MAPSLIVAPLFYQEMCYDMLKIDIFSYKTAYFHQWDTTHVVLQFYLLSPMVFTLFLSKYEFKFNVSVLLIVAPLQKLVLAPGATIQDNTVLGFAAKILVTLAVVELLLTTEFRTPADVFIH